MCTETISIAQRIFDQASLSTIVGETARTLAGAACVHQCTDAYLTAYRFTDNSILHVRGNGLCTHRIISMEACS
jgi:hypothetical protein